MLNYYITTRYGTIRWYPTLREALRACIDEQRDGWVSHVFDRHGRHVAG